MPQTLPKHYADTLPEVRHVEFDRPLAWLRAGWQDLAADPKVSLAHGAFVALAGGLVLFFALPQPHLFSLAVSAFFLVAPLLAAGLYEISRRHERGEAASLADSFAGWRRNAESISLFGLALAIVAVAWERLSAILFALLYSGGFDASAGFGAFLAAVLFSGEHRAFALVWMLVGGTLAAFVFACSVVSIPMLLDRDNESGGDIVTATLTSLHAVGQNLAAMTAWAILIVGLVLIGIATFMLGLVVLMPLIGHASWHAYRDLVAPAPVK